MKRLIAMGLCVVLLGAGACVYGEDGPDVTYVGGSVPGIKEGTAGRLDMTSASELRFQAGGTELAVPYAQISRVEYREQNRFRLGVVATIVVGMVKAREKVHTVTISWKDKDTANVAILLMPKEKAVGLLSVFEARAPEACRSGLHSNCTLPK